MQEQNQDFIESKSENVLHLPIKSTKIYMKLSLSNVKLFPIFDTKSQ